MQGPKTQKWMFYRVWDYILGQVVSEHRFSYTFLLFFSSFGFLFLWMQDKSSALTWYPQPSSQLTAAVPYNHFRLPSHQESSNESSSDPWERDSYALSGPRAFPGHKVQPCSRALLLQSEREALDLADNPKVSYKPWTNISCWSMSLWCSESLVILEVVNGASPAFGLCLLVLSFLAPLTFVWTPCKLLISSGGSCKQDILEKGEVKKKKCKKGKKGRESNLCTFFFSSCHITSKIWLLREGVGRKQRNIFSGPPAALPSLTHQPPERTAATPQCVTPPPRRPQLPTLLHPSPLLP